MSLSQALNQFAQNLGRYLTDTSIVILDTLTIVTPPLRITAPRNGTTKIGRIGIDNIEIVSNLAVQIKIILR